MRLLVFSVLDDKAVGYAHPFVAMTRGIAERMFHDWVSDERTPISKHPGDYRLFQVGSFDDETGLLESLPTPMLLVHGSRPVGVPKERAL